MPGATVNRLCGSGLQAVIDGARAIAVGDADLVIAGGVESMSRAPLVMPKAREAFPRGDVTVHDSTLGWRFVNPRMEALHGTHALGETAELVAEKYGVTREAQDAFALHEPAALGGGARRRALRRRAGAPSSCRRRRGRRAMFDVDEHPRPETTAADLAALRARVPQAERDGDGRQLVGHQRRRGGGAAGVAGGPRASRRRAPAARPLRRVGASPASSRS